MGHDPTISAPWRAQLCSHILPPWGCHFTHVLSVHKAVPTACFAASAVEPFVCLGQFFVQVLDRAKSSPWLAQAAARCRIRICVQAANVFAAEFLDSSCSRLPMPPTSFPAWLGHSIVKPMFVNNLRCRFFFDELTAAQICAADFSHCWHSCQHP